jgi:ubiquinone biosynthesis protein
MHGALSRLNHLDETQADMQAQLTALTVALEAQRRQTKHQVLGVMATLTGGLLWWQAYALGLPELLGLGVGAAGLIWLVIKG